METNRKTINKILKEVENALLLFVKRKLFFTRWVEVEIDESYFGAKRIHGKRGGALIGNTIVFGLKQREGKVYTQVIKNGSQKAIIPL